MQTKGWIAPFQEWLKDNQAHFVREKVRIEVLGITPYVPSSIHVNFFSERYEATVQLWEDGQSEFYFADWAVADRDPHYQLEVVHHDFQGHAEMYAALDQLLNRMSPVLV